MKSQKDQNILISLFTPHYDEQRLFIMGYVCLLLLFINNPPAKWKIPHVIYDISIKGQKIHCTEALGRNEQRVWDEARYRGP